MNGQWMWRKIGKGLLMLFVMVTLSVSPSWAMELRPALLAGDKDPTEQEAIGLDMDRVGIDADQLDGYHASDLAMTHMHAGQVWTSNSTALRLEGNYFGLHSSGVTGVYGYSEGPIFGPDMGAFAGVKGVAVSEPAAEPSAPVGVWGASGDKGYAGYFANASPEYSTLMLTNLSTNGLLIEALNGATGERTFSVSTNGTVAATGPYVTQAADFATMLTGEKDLGPGDVLVIGRDGWLTKSTAPYQTNVVGVYSAQPGFIGGMSAGNDLVSKVPLALAGVVTVKVTLENGPIQPGDLLTSSSTPGYAMRATVRILDGIPTYPSGSILGKALTAFNAKEGTLMMLVMVR